MYRCIFSMHIFVALQKEFPILTCATRELQNFNVLPEKACQWLLESICGHDLY